MHATVPLSVKSGSQPGHGKLVWKTTRHVRKRRRLSCRLHKLQQKHAQRQKLAQRAQATTTEDEIAWDDDTPGPSPVASPQQPANTERTPADKVRQREGRVIRMFLLLLRSQSLTEEDKGGLQLMACCSVCLQAFCHLGHLAFELHHESAASHTV